MALLKILFLPPVGFLVLALCGLLLRRRWPLLAGTCISVGLVALFLISLPAVGTSLLMLHQDYPPLPADQLTADLAASGGPQAIVVLGADFDERPPEYGAPQPTDLTFARLRYAAYLHGKTGLPLLVSAGNEASESERGGVVMKRALEEELGASVALVEQASTTTAENAVFSAELLRREGIERIYLVTHAWHMPRAMAAFEREGLVVTAAPTDFATAPSLALFDWLPSPRGLQSSYYFFHEALGRIAYALRPAS